MKSLKRISTLFFMLMVTLVLITVSRHVSNANVIALDVPFSRLTKVAQQEIGCLAENIYFEARNEPIAGQYAVAFVTMNRVKSGLYPDNICGVVKQKIQGTCQFSWWCEDKPYYISTNNLLTRMGDTKYNEIVKIATNFYANHENLNDPTKGALFYHADYVNPHWKNTRKVVQIGRHIFYERKHNGI